MTSLAFGGITSSSITNTSDNNNINNHDFNIHMNGSGQQQQHQSQMDQWGRPLQSPPSQSQSQSQSSSSARPPLSSPSQSLSPQTLHPPMSMPRSSSNSSSGSNSSGLSPMLSPNSSLNPPLILNNEFGRSSSSQSGSNAIASSPNSSTPYYQPLSSVSPSPSGASSSPSPDPLHSRSHDPARIQALIQVIQQLADSGVTQKFLSQLGIVFKQLHPNLFVKGILKELVDHASHCGLLTLTGPAGQQQVELTVAGQAIARTWRQNHETQNQQQLASLKETLQMQAATGQFDSNWNGPNSNSNSNTSSNSFKPNLAFLDDHTNENSYLTSNRGTNNTGGASINNTNSSINTTASSLHSSGQASLNNTGGSFASHLEAQSASDVINTTSGSFAAHPKDSSRLDLNNLFGPTSSNIFGVTDAEDSELLSNWNDSELTLEPYSTKSANHVNNGTDVHSSYSLLVGGANGGSTNTTSGSGFGASSHYPPLLQSSRQAAPTPYATNFSGASGNSSSHLSHLNIPHPAQNHINGSNIHAFLGASTTPATSNPASTNTTNNNVNQYSQQQQSQQLMQPQLGLHEPVLPDPSALQLLPPLPTSLEEKSFRGERLKHLKYIFHFRVHPCLNFLQKGSCQYDNKNECFDYHSLKTRRRIPRIYQFSNGIFWSYNACRCQAIEKEMRCEKGEGCRYAHCKEEIAYHPSRFKSAPCSYPLRADGSCSRFGLHCAFSHGEADVRKPIVLKQGMPHKLVEPSLHMLQEQQQLVAALTGLSLAELNSFSMSGHNNSMSFGGGGNQSTNSTGGNSLHSSSSSLHLSSGASSPYGSLSLTQPTPSSHNVMASHPALSTWEASQGSQSLQNLHSTDSPPMMYDKYNINASTNPASTNSTSRSLTGLTNSTSQLSINANLSQMSPSVTDLNYGTAPNSPTLHPVNTDPSFLLSLNPNEYICPPEELPAERDFYLYQYKVHPCKNQTLACTKGECPSFHYENKRRRNPRVFRYSHEPCIVVHPPTPHGTVQHDLAHGSNWRRPSACRLGDQCEFSHTLLESMYHPLIWKTQYCKNFDERDRSTWQRCPWKRACAHAHSRAELEYAEACSREYLQQQRTNTLPSSSIGGGGNSAVDASRLAWSSSASPSMHLDGRGLFVDPNSITSNSYADTSGSKTPENAENALPGIAADGTHVQFPSPPTQGGTGTGSNTPSYPMRELANSPSLTNQMNDESMRSVLLKQDTAARILRMQQQQLQPLGQNQSQSMTNSSSTSSVLGGNSIVDTLRSENVHLLDRLSRYEKELYMLKHRLDDKESLIKQLQWTIDTEREEKTRAVQQLDQFRQEVTQRLLQQHQQQHQHQQHQHQQLSSQLPSASPSSYSQSHSSFHGENELRDGHTASTGVAESVLISPGDQLSPHDKASQESH